MAAQPQLDRAAAVALILGGQQELAALPQVVFKVMEITGTDNGSSSELERAIVIDPGFSAKLLSIANSAHFSLPKQVTSIKEAVMYVGVRQVRQTAMAVGVFDMFLGKTDIESKRRRAWWRHSVDTATAARALAAEFGWADPNEAYTAGLLHWCGKTVLDKSAPGEYEKVVSLIDKGVPAWQAETAIFGCDHRDIALACASNWGFPSGLVAGLKYFSRPDDARSPGELAATVAAASQIADYACNGRPKDGKWADWASETLGIPTELTEKVIERGLAAITAGSHLHF